MRDGFQSTSAIALAASGAVSAFALAACCALPLGLAALGVGSAWLAPIVTPTQPHADALSIFSLLTLVSSIAVVLRAAKVCAPGSLCARRGFRFSILGAALAGGILLLLSRIYA